MSEINKLLASSHKDNDNTVFDNIFANEFGMDFEKEVPESSENDYLGMDFEEEVPESSENDYLGMDSDDEELESVIRTEPYVFTHLSR